MKGLKKLIARLEHFPCRVSREMDVKQDNNYCEVFEVSYQSVYAARPLRYYCPRYLNLSKFICNNNWIF
jgi:hypothetical protein